MKIGITERGDAGIDLSWTNKAQNMDVSILITKNITNKFLENVRKLQETNNLIIHATCTGWGGTYMEPHVPSYEKQLTQLKKLTEFFPKSQCVLRIDPIIPTTKGLRCVQLVLDKACDLGLMPMRVRVSIVDEYRHVKERLAKTNRKPIYDQDRKYPNRTETQAVKALLESYKNFQFETCAETYLIGQNIEHTGCVSKKDLDIFGLITENINVNPQQRTGCLCLTGKTEMLENKHRCPHKCLYCYWRD